MKKHTFYLFLLIALAGFFLFFYFKLVTPGFLTFSDGAKFADVAKNIKSGLGYGSTFSFFSKSGLGQAPTGIFSARWIPPLMPLAVAASFSIFGISDFAVFFTSGVFYLGLVILIFLIGRKLFGNLIGFLAGLAVAFNLNILDYATSGASETLFIFEILLTIYLFLLKKRWANIAGFLGLILLYFTRPHAPIYILGIWLFYLLINYRKTKSFIKALGLTAVAVIVIELLLQKFSGKFFLESILKRGSIAALSYSSSIAGDTVLRGATVSVDTGLLQSLAPLAKKVFYNLYNFYKLLPQIVSPYMWALFVIGLFKWGKDKVENSLKIATIFMVIATFLVTALTIPFFRYLHSVVPLVYLFATATLVWIVGKMVKKRLVVIVSALLIIFFVVGQTLGVIFLDSRFKAKRTNRGKPPIYAQLSWLLRDNTVPGDIIVTNLDTWGSWYGERKTVWFPLKPDQLRLGEGDKLVFDAIFLTSYLIDDENYYMGDEWREIFLNPENIKDEFIEQNYELTGMYTIPAEETYEKQAARAVLLTRKKINGL